MFRAVRIVFLLSNPGLYTFALVLSFLVSLITKGTISRFLMQK